MVTIFQSMRELQFNLIPISLHYDGFAVLARPEWVEFDLQEIGINRIVFAQRATVAPSRVGAIRV
jgi:hypothetical protein